MYLLFKLKDGRKVMLEEMKGNWSADLIPEGWNEVNGQVELLFNDIKLQQHGFNQLDLINLKRMIDGLNPNV